MYVRKLIGGLIGPLLPYVARYKYNNQHSYLRQGPSEKSRKGYVPYVDILAGYKKDLNTWVRQGYVE